MMLIQRTKRRTTPSQSLLVMAVAGFLASSLPATVTSFTPTQIVPASSIASTLKKHQATTRTPIRLDVVPPETHHLLGDLATSVDPAVAVQHAFDSTSQWLSDAAAATADADGSSALADAAADKSWWQQWLNIFKITLAAVHSTIDGPLRSLGVEQTWGVSIFLFTACKFVITFSARA